MKSSVFAHPKLKLKLRDNRLNFNHVPMPFRGFTVQVVAVALIACLIIVLSGLDIYPFETTIEVPESLSPIHASLTVPISLMFLTLIGLGVVASAQYYASFLPDWKLPRATRLTLGIFILGLPLTFLDYTLVTLQTGIGKSTTGLAFLLLALCFGVMALIFGFVGSPRLSLWAARLVKGSFLGIAIAFLAFTLRVDILSPVHYFNIEIVSQSNLLIANLITYFTPLVWMTGIIFFWQAITEVKLFSRNIGLWMADVSARIPWLFAVVIFVKITWLVIGYWGLMGENLGEPWNGSRQDGPLAWLLAVLFAIIAGWWMTHWKKPVDTTLFNKTAWILTGGFLFPFIMAFLIFFPAIIFVNLGLDNVGLFLGTISVYLSNEGLIWSIIFTVLLIPLGIVLLFIKRLRHLTSVFFIPGLWSLPAVIQALFANLNLSFEYLTFDVALTLVLLVLAVLIWRRKLQKVNIWIITLVLIVSTLVALAESLIPANRAYLGYTLLLVVPLLYQLLFDSAELNIIGATKGQRVIRTFSLQAGLMVVIAMAVVLKLMSPNQLMFEDVANKIFLPPILALFLTGIISNHENPSEQNPGKAP